MLCPCCLTFKRGSTIKYHQEHCYKHALSRYDLKCWKQYKAQYIINHRLATHPPCINSYFSSLTLYVMHASLRCQECYTMSTLSKNYLNRDLDGNLDCNLDCDPDDVCIYTGHPLFNTKCIILLFTVQSLLHRNLPKILFNLSRSWSRSSVYTGQNFSIQMAM